MTPIDDPELRDVKEDIRKSVRGFYLIMSSGSGSSPLLRAHQSIEGDKICRFRRSAKNASVFMAASFSATAGNELIYAHAIGHAAALALTERGSGSR